MAIHRDHELHTRRWGRNMGLGLVLLAFVGLIFVLTFVKVSRQVNPDAQNVEVTQ